MDNPLQLACALVVEDEAFSQQVIVQMLTAIGVGRVLTAANGLEALEVLESCEGSIEVVVTDVAMPELDGYELIRRIRLGALPDAKDIPIIVLTANDDEKNLQHARVLTCLLYTSDAADE